MKRNGEKLLGLGVNRKRPGLTVRPIVCTAEQKVAKVVRVRFRIVLQ